MSAEPESRPADNGEESRGDASPAKKEESRKSRSRSRSRSRGSRGGGGGGGRRSRSRSRSRGGGGGGGGGGRSRSRSRSRSRGRGGGGGKKRLKGTACRWNVRGFGFIKPDDGGEDLFCHVSSIKDGNAMRDGDIVEYEESWDDRKGKYMADNVTGGCREEDTGGRGRGGGRDRYDDRYDDRRRDRDRYDDRYDDRRRDRDYDRRY